MRRFLILLFLIFTTVTCSQKFTEDKTSAKASATCEDECVARELTVRIDPTYSMTHQEQVYMAVAAWSVRTGNTLNVTFIVTEELFDDEDHPATVTIFNRYPGDGLAGWASWRSDIRGAKIYMLDDLSDDDFLRIAKHEFGHAFDLMHYEGDLYSIMNSSLDGNEDITCHDIADYCSKWGCSPNCVLVSASTSPVFVSKPTVCAMKKTQVVSHPGPSIPQEAYHLPKR